eukprot:g35623.t1
MDNWAGQPWATHVWWPASRNDERPPPVSSPRFVLACFRATRGRGCDIKDSFFRQLQSGIVSKRVSDVVCHR